MEKFSLLFVIQAGAEYLSNSKTILNSTALVFILCCFLLCMQEKMFLRRKTFTTINYINIALNLALAVNDGAKGKDKMAFRILTVFYLLIMAACMYLLTIRTISVSFMLKSIYLGFTNSAVLLIIAFLRFLFRFKEDNPYGIVIESIPVLCVIFTSLATAMFVIIVRKYIIQGLISPTTVQREKGIDSAVVILRKEYPEIFQ